MVRFIMANLEPCRFSCLWKNKVMVFERYSKFLYTYQIFDIAAPLGEKSQTSVDERFAYDEFAFKENAKH